MADTDYTQGFRNGIRHEREALLEFIELHSEASIHDLEDEINSRYESDMRLFLKQHLTPPECACGACIKTELYSRLYCQDCYDYGCSKSEERFH